MDIVKKDYNWLINFYIPNFPSSACLKRLWDDFWVISSLPLIKLKYLSARLAFLNKSSSWLFKASSITFWEQIKRFLCVSSISLKTASVASSNASLNSSICFQRDNVSSLILSWLAIIDALTPEAIKWTAISWLLLSVIDFFIWMVVLWY